MRDHLRFYRHRWFKAWIALVVLSVSLIAMMQAAGNQAVMPGGLLLRGRGRAHRAPARHPRPYRHRHQRAGRDAGGDVPFRRGRRPPARRILRLAFHLPEEQSPRSCGSDGSRNPRSSFPPLAVALTGRHLTKAAGVALGLACATGFTIMESMAYAWKSIVNNGGAVSAGTILSSAASAPPSATSSGPAWSARWPSGRGRSRAALSSPFHHRRLHDGGHAALAQRRPAHPRHPGACPAALHRRRRGELLAVPPGHPRSGPGVAPDPEPSRT